MLTLTSRLVLSRVGTPLAPLRPENLKALEASLQSFEARTDI